MDIKVLGAGCKGCTKTYELLESICKELNIDANLQKVQDAMEIMDLGVMSTPAVIIDDEIVHSGGTPDESTIRLWLENK